MLLLLAAVVLSAEPPLLRLGTDARAVLHIRAPVAPTVSVSAGSASAPVAAGDGTFDVEYLPPDDAVPQVAIVIAVAGDDAGSLAIPLWGQGDALVKTRPRAEISVDIGAQTFGPVTADARGEALVPVVVAPGITHARQGRRAIDLHVPPTRTIHVALTAPGPADQPQTLRVYVAAVDPIGSPRAGARIRLDTSRGDLSPLRDRGAGLYEASLRLAAGPAGAVRVTAALEDAPRLAATAAVRLVPGAAERIDVTADVDRIVADGAREVALHAIARDAAGNAAGEAIRFEASFGELRTVPRAPGAWDLVLSVPPAFGGRTEVRVRASGARASAERALALLPGPPASASVEVPPRPPVADGTTAVRLPLQIVDRYGNPVSAPAPEISADRGAAELERSGPALAAKYVPPRLRERGESTVTVRAGDARAQAQVALAPWRPWAAVSPRVGWMSNFSGFSAPLLGVQADLRTDRYGPELGIAVEADYAVRMQTERIATGAADAAAESRIDLLLLHVSAALRHDAWSRSTVWLAAGPSAAAYWTRVGVSGAPAQRGFAVAPGLQISAGFERRMTATVPFVELRAGWISGSGLPNLSGPLRTMSVLAGVRFEAL